MKNISSVLRLDREFLKASECIASQLKAEKPLPIAVNGLFGGAMNAFLSESIKDILSKSSGAVLVLTSNEEERKKCHDALLSYGIDSLEYKDRDLVFHNVSASHDIERERLSVLSELLSGRCRVVISTLGASVLYTMPKSTLSKSRIKISLGEKTEPALLAKSLSDMGYTRVELCEAVGQFSKRGDILDVFSGGEEYPVRIEFFGDEVDRISRFDPITQRSLENAEEISVLPAHELLFDGRARTLCASELDTLLKSLPEGESKDTLKREKKLFESGIIPESRDKFLGICYQERATLFSYLEDMGMLSVIITDANALSEAKKRRTAKNKDEASALVNNGLISAKSANYRLPDKEYEAIIKRNLCLYIHPFAGGFGASRSLGGLFGFSTRKTVSYGENPSMLREDLENYKKSGYRVLMLCENGKAVKSLSETLLEWGFSVSDLRNKESFDFSSAEPGSIYIDKSDADGFELLALRFAVLSMKRDDGRRIMENRRRTRILKKSGGVGERLMSHADLSVGDYVVHANYGIGIFEGIESVRVDGVTRDYITIRYRGTDKLFVPCERLEYIGKYIGARERDGSVKLSQMGTQEWTRTKNRTKSAVRDIAKDLIKLYAQRQRTAGFAFPPDSELEDEFAESFEYELTDSQAEAIDEIKRDMQKPVPMNRLLCGDVGFGKTEVALRAAFKAIMGGKQVAILVPTTILAMQHYRTAVQRMRDYPVTVEMLSRFKTPSQEKKIIEKLARGGIDLLIGTHKLLSKNIKFKNLGLLIVDEEQRFGVAQKEKLKAVAQNVDVLTLSATPIPRTLNMAMNGISDMSILDEAPGERKPVQTYVLEYSETVIFEALKRELARGGQVLYLYNNTENIGLLADRIVRAVPEARVAVAHGKMDKDELEDTWDMLVRGEIDVLVCTTIIETGVDLPNANTLIIENADRMGLSQLHQLRGRVGRSRRQAYAYFTYREGKALSEIATKRLSAIRDYAEFGAGFKVALRDLEIRGAGNLLGSEQHGYIDGVGYELYVKLLSEAVMLERGEEPPLQFESTVDIKIDAHIPEYYIKSSAGRMEMYKKISLIETQLDCNEISDELFDRYGDIPRETQNLLDVALCRALLSSAKIARLTLDGGNLLFIGDEKPNLAVWSELIAKRPEIIIKSAQKTNLSVRLAKSAKPLKLAIEILNEYLEVLSTEEKGNG